MSETVEAPEVESGYTRKKARRSAAFALAALQHALGCLDGTEGCAECIRNKAMLDEGDFGYESDVLDQLTHLAELKSRVGLLVAEWTGRRPGPDRERASSMAIAQLRTCLENGPSLRSLSQEHRDHLAGLLGVEPVVVARASDEAANLRELLTTTRDALGLAKNEAAQLQGQLERAQARTKNLEADMTDLTERQEEIAELLRAGKTNQQVIDKLGCSSPTVSKVRRLIGLEGGRAPKGSGMPKRDAIVPASEAVDDVDVTEVPDGGGADTERSELYLQLADLRELVADLSLENMRLRRVARA